MLSRFFWEGRLQGLAPLISPLRVAAIAGNISPVTPLGFVPLQGLPVHAAPGSPPRLFRSRRCRRSLHCHLNSSLHRSKQILQLARGLTLISARLRPGIPKRLFSTGLSPVSAPQPGLGCRNRPALPARSRLAPKSETRLALCPHRILMTSRLSSSYRRQLLRQARFRCRNTFR